MAAKPPSLRQLRVGIPFARYAGAPVAPVRMPPNPPTNVATAAPGDPLDGDRAAKYGRLTNPDLLVAAGDWARVQSSFLWAIRFVPYAEDADAPSRSTEQQVGDLYLEFVNGFVGKWPDRTYQNYRAYLQAPSKGKYHRSTPWYHGPYETITAQVYFGAALTARINANK